MKIVHCNGHEFEYPTVAERLTSNWAFRCRHCGLKVTTKEAANYLTGRRS